MKGTESIIVDYTLNEPPDQIWRLLTEPKLLEQWLMPNDIAPIVGHKFNFRTAPMGDWDGIVHCEILEVDQPHKLVYSWKGGSKKNEAYGHEIDTIATWTLTPTPNGGTLLHLEHSGFEPTAYAFQVMGPGWHKMMPAEKATRLLTQAV